MEDLDLFGEPPAVAASERLTLDLDGVGSVGTARLYAAFGGEIVPRFTASRADHAYRAQRAVLRLGYGLSRRGRRAGALIGRSLGSGGRGARHGVVTGDAAV